MEDGREIFDDEEEFEDSKTSKGKNTSKSKRKRDTEPVAANKKGSLKNFFSKTDGKKKEVICLSHKSSKKLIFMRFLGSNQ